MVTCFAKDFITPGWLLNMRTISPNSFISTVIQNFDHSHSQNPNPIIDWFECSLFNAHSSREDIDKSAQEILSKLNEVIPITNKKRYKFRQLNPRDELLKIMLEKSFDAAPAAVIRAAERENPSQGPFYPLWKRICWIKIPQNAAASLKNPFVKSMAVLCFAYCFYSLVKKVYQFAFNLHLSIQEDSNPNTAQATVFAFVIAAGCFAGIILSTTPYIFEGCNNTSLFLEKIATKTENERLAISKAKAYDAWKKTINIHIPKHQTN